MKRSLQGALLLLALLVSSRVAAAAPADGGVDASSSEAGAPELPPEYAPLKCDGSLCDTTTGETACSLSEGRSAKGGAWPFVMLLALAAACIGRRAQSPLRRVS
jgi:hypothetical protein